MIKDTKKIFIVIQIQLPLNTIDSKNGYISILH